MDAMRSLFVTACGQMTSELCKLSAPQCWLLTVGEAMAFPRKPGKRLKKDGEKWGRFVLKLAPWYCISKFKFVVVSEEHHKTNKPNQTNQTKQTNK